MSSKGTNLSAASQRRTGELIEHRKLKRNLHVSSANVKITESETVVQRFVNPQDKKRRLENEGIKGKHGNIDNHAKPRSMETSPTSRMVLVKSEPDESSLCNVIKGSPAMAQSPSPPPEIPLSPWAKSSPKNAAEPTIMTSSLALTTSNQLGQKDIPVAPSSPIFTLVLGQPVLQPDAQTDQLPGSSLPNEEMQVAGTAQPSTISGANVGCTNPSFGKEVSQTTSPAEHVPLRGTLAQDTECPTTSQGLPKLSQPDEEDLNGNNPSSQATSLPKPAATREKLLEILGSFNEDTLSSMAQQCEAKNLHSTVTNIMQHMMEKKLARQFSWTGTSSKINCVKLKFENSPEQKFMKKILEKTSFAKEKESDIRKAVVRTLHNVPDWGNGRCSRRQRCETNHGEGPSSLNAEEVNGLGPNHCDDIVIHERIDMLMKRMKFEEAISLLEGHPTTVMQQLRLFECNYQLQREEKVMEVLENMKRLMVRSPQYKANDLRILGWDVHHESSHIKAVPFFICAAKLYPLVSDPNEVVNGICNCAVGCYMMVIEIMEQNRLMPNFAWGVGLKITNDLLNDIKAVTNSDPHVKVCATAWCLCITGICYRMLENCDKAKEFFQRGIDVLIDQFGSDSSNYAVYRNILDCMALTNGYLKNCSEAKNLCERTKNALERAEDWKNYTNTNM